MKMKGASAWMDTAAYLAQTASGYQYVHTQEIVGQTLTMASKDDASQVKPLLAQIEGDIVTYTGDGAYDR